MLVKEYRIALPMSVEEYRIAQLYMIQKKSREETSGTGSGVEIIQNEPYEDGPGGKGQYTYKIYHIGSHLPGWFRAILPKSALRVEEEAWNAYPYTKTIYRCPFIEKFLLEIETVYLSDGGTQENIFKLSNNELRNRTVDIIDIVKDPIANDYVKEEDPTLFLSAKTDRGPLIDSWRTDYIEDIDNDKNCGKEIMCAYKLCKVEFKYWGMQSKIERFIHDIGLRKTMLRAHRQAWCWQDEYYGLTIEDIRELERQTQLALQEKMAALAREAEGGVDGQVEEKSDTVDTSKPARPAIGLPQQDSIEQTSVEVLAPLASEERPRSAASMGSTRPYGSQHSRKSSLGSVKSRKSLTVGHNELDAAWRVESLEKLATESSDEEFFDAREDMSRSVLSLANAQLYGRSSSMELLTPDEEYQDMPAGYADLGSTQLDRRAERMPVGPTYSCELPTTPCFSSQVSQHACKTTILFIVVHGGSLLDSGHPETGSKHADLATLRATMEATVRDHYPDMLGHIAWRLIACPHICTETLKLLTSLSPYSSEWFNSEGAESGGVSQDSLPLAAISLFMTGNAEYADSVSKVIIKANQTYSDFLRSEEGLGFSGQVCLIGDSVGSILAYDALCKNNPYLYGHDSRYGSHNSLLEEEDEEQVDSLGMSSDCVSARRENINTSNPDVNVTSETPQKIQDDPFSASTANQTSHNQRTQSVRRHHSHTESRGQGTSTNTRTHASCPNSRRTSTGSNPSEGRFEFDVAEFFMFGSPLAVVLAYRRMCLSQDQHSVIPKPSCAQVYNIFYPSDPSAARIEPLLCDKFRSLAPPKVCRYQKFPLGDGHSLHLVDAIQNSAGLFRECSSPGVDVSDERRLSNMSIQSQISGHGELNYSAISNVMCRMWGSKRLDYALYCPDAVQSFPTTALPNLLHSSFWESTDAAAFILRQVIRQEFMSGLLEGGKIAANFKPNAPREKWLKRRTTIKLKARFGSIVDKSKNVAPNHRANDVIILEDKPQILTGRFIYGPLDMVSLTGEKVDIHVMKNPSSGEWQYFGTEVTDSNGRCTYHIPDNLKLPLGMYPVKMVVRGDHTSVDFFLCVLPPRTECVVFSIDGSFTASVSIMGKDPKVRAGAVDVVRHWQELGFLIVYVTARPDMQQKKVVAWLAQHNFPHGMTCFMEGISADPLRQKMNQIKSLAAEADLVVHAAYGSNKDITVYQALNIPPNNIFIVGKVSKKQHKDANVLTEGYAVHLTDLASHCGSRSAQGNARLFLRRGCFSLPGQLKVGGKKSVRKTVSLPQRGGSIREHLLREQKDITVSGTGNTVVEPGLSVAGTAAKSRGSSPRVKAPPLRFENSNV